MHGNVVLLNALLASALFARSAAAVTCQTGATCEEDEVTLLHARKASLAKGEHAEHEEPRSSMNRTAVSEAAASVIQEKAASQGQAEKETALEAEMATLLSSEPGLPGWLGANHTKEFREPSASLLLQVGQAVSSSFSSYSSGLGLVLAFTFFAFLCSCCAVMVTRAFIQDQRQNSDSLAQHERRQRLLQSFASSVRTPKKGPGGEGLPSPVTGPASAIAVPPTTPTRRAGAGLRSPWRRIVVDTPLEGDRLGVNLTEDTLIIIDYSDPRAETLGFKVGERVVHINGVPVFQQLDFQKVLSGAFREFHRSGQPIVISTVEPASSYPNNLSLLPEMEDICGRWQMTNGEIFVISRLPGLQYLLMTMLAGGQPSASGLVMVHSAEELRCQLIRTDGSQLGDVRICYRESMMEVTFAAQGGTWGKPLPAWRATGDGPTPQQTGVSLPRPTVQSSPPESLPPSTLR